MDQQSCSIRRVGKIGYYVKFFFLQHIDRDRYQFHYKRLNLVIQPYPDYFFQKSRDTNNAETTTCINFMEPFQGLKDILISAGERCFQVAD